ncbi:MAG: hypothetical protein KA758_03440 [Acidimicrobiales bacterium]|nr:hypothetical protein [Acidimicrobiales bacterium]
METDQAPTGADEYLASRMQDPQYADAWLRERIGLALDGFAGSTFHTTDDMVNEVMAVVLDHQELIENIMGHIWLHARDMDFVLRKMTTEERRAWDAYLAGWKYRMDTPVHEDGWRTPATHKEADEAHRAGVVEYQSDEGCAWLPAKDLYLPSEGDPNIARYRVPADWPAGRAGDGGGCDGTSDGPTREEAAMNETVIHVGGDKLADTLAGHWRKGAYGNDEAMCLHGAIRRCCPVPGDALLIELVEARLGRWSTSWNDDDDRTEAEVVELARRGWDITDADLAETFGPQWRAVVSVVRRAATLTADEAKRLDAAWDAAWGAARGAAWDAARDAAWGAARGAAWDAARDAAWAVVTWDLATDDGPYTTAMRDLLIGPWVEVCGLPEGLIEREDNER